MTDKPENNSVKEALERIASQLGPETADQVVSSFQKGLDTLVEHLNDAFERRDQERMRFVARQLKSACVAVGAIEMQKICDRVEAAAEEKSPSWDLLPLSKEIQKERIDLHRFLNNFKPKR